MKAVITVIGKDMVGIIAKVTAVLAEANANVLEITQTILQQYFAMIMIVDTSKMTCSLDELKADLNERVEGMTIHVMHEDIFDAMHHV